MRQLTYKLPPLTTLPQARAAQTAMSLLFGNLESVLKISISHRKGTYLLKFVADGLATKAALQLLAQSAPTVVQATSQTAAAV